MVNLRGEEEGVTPEQDVAFLVRDVPPPGNAGNLRVLVSLTRLERARKDGELMVLPGVRSPSVARRCCELRQSLSDHPETPNIENMTRT